jgi:alkylation response protein AidB-like acyl-CoA dehydrogenase
MQSKNQPMTYEPSATKVYGSELNQFIAQVGISLAGLWGQVEADSRVPRGGALSTSYKGSISSTIAAGTSEIQRNIIAQALGLPRSYDP